MHVKVPGLLLGHCMNGLDADLVDAMHSATSSDVWTLCCAHKLV